MALKLKYYSEEDGDLCYPLQHFIDEDSEPVILEEMKRHIGGEMWCTELFDFVDGECGDLCDFYKPCNGVSGRCRKLKHGFIETGKKYELKDGIITLLDSK